MHPLMSNIPFLQFTFTIVVNNLLKERVQGSENLLLYYMFFNNTKEQAQIGCVTLTSLAWINNKNNFECRVKLFTNE